MRSGTPPNPGADQLGPVRRMPIDNQVDLPSAAIAEQPAQKVDEHRAAERPHNSRNRSIPWLEMALIM